MIGLQSERVDISTAVDPDSMTMVVSNSDNWRSAILIGFRAAAGGQMVAVFAQALLGGLALSGNSGALTAHMVNGALALVLSIVQMVFGLLLKSKLPPWVLAASVGLFLGEMAQMASGRRYLFAIHFPLGLALFATLVPLMLWIVRGTSMTFDRAPIAPADVGEHTA
jgi:hypothetical protein